ncbi:hypothetical protein E4U53_004194 [Claviceps sorghi]|nr:hypothetical protein E4U53_004194 [Claviceps sorghi]
MALTKTVHPPAGATALLAVVDAALVRIGWFLLPVVLLGSALMLAVALLVNNIERRFPVYWWTPGACGRRSRRRGCADGDEQSPSSDEPAPHLPKTHRRPREIVIRRGELVLPRHMVLSPEEERLLETMSHRL